MAELFTQEELEELERRATELAHEHESDVTLRSGLQLLAEAAANLAPKVAHPQG